MKKKLTYIRINIDIYTTYNQGRKIFIMGIFLFHVFHMIFHDKVISIVQQQKVL